MTDLAAQLAKAQWQNLPAAAKDKLKLCLIANVSVAVAGRAYAKLALPQSVATGHLLLSGGCCVDAAQAAWANATLMHARNQDDFHPEGRLHTGTIVIPAALAVAEAQNLSGIAFLDCLVAGYAAGVAVSEPYATVITQRGFRATGLFGPFAAAGAAARGYRLNEAQTDHAMGIAASMAGGLGQCWVDGGDEWQLQAAEAARAGVVAAQLARNGSTGAKRAFDGKAGFIKAFTGQPPAENAELWHVDAARALNEIVVKRYSVSGINQSLVQVAERMATRNRDALGRIKRITLGFHDTDFNYPGTNNVSSFNTFADRMMSAAFCSASVFARGHFDFNDMFADATLESARLIAATKLGVDNRVVPFGCRIELELDDGRVLVDEMIDPARELVIDLGAVDGWAIPLWQAGGRDRAKYEAFRNVVMSLETRPLSDFLAACR